jgi:diadenosine tetraphosphate (Ap4A) HIT family hydrolase
MACVFCAVVAGEAPAIRIYEDDDYLAILDVRPFTRGHTLVIPKRHTVDLTDTPRDTVAAMVRIGQRIARAARQSGLHADGNNVVINDGTGRIPERVAHPSARTAAAERRQAVIRQGHAAAEGPGPRRVRPTAARSAGATRLGYARLTPWTSPDGSSRTSAPRC